ncbi:signal recognition particle-docking protein FtsY [Candidatus Pacearchaeota archaeon]|nr:signal recognition particle-docking protein FtsY [Candidatus Pacearchaeota archaeon]
MFKFLKDKLSNLFKKKSREIVEEAEVKQEPELVEKREEVKEIKKEIIQVEEKKQEVLEKIHGLEEEKGEKPTEKRIIEKKIEKKKEELEQLEEKEEEKKEEIIKKEEIEEKEEKRPGFFARLAKKIIPVGTIRLEEKHFDDLWNDLELILIENNAALEVLDKIKEKLKKELVGKEIKRNEIEQTIRQALKNAISDLLLEPFDLIEKIKHSEKPYVIVFFGINGSGKTTTIAKFANLLKQNNLTCVLAAADTYRAASIEQLAIHAERLGVKMIKHDYQADPAAVAFDAIKHAKAAKIDVVLIDTAGRMHTQSNLLAEMQKIVRVAKPNLKIFIGESITGNDAVEQAKKFSEMIGIDGIILSKADVDEKGGTAISVGYATGKPILYLGTGQEYKDLEKFDKEKIIQGLGLE